jgi:sucrose-phosphate synthase
MHIALVSLHGLFRGDRPPIGLDADNGGQIVYVLELARALGELPEVERVHLFTRLVDDPRLDRDYAAPRERVHPKVEIVRIPFGGPRYLPKEALWPHLDEFVAGALDHIARERLALDWLHSHYADAGFAAVRMARALGVPFVHTAHSLGRRKLETLLASGMSRDEAMRRYRFADRFAAEDAALAGAAIVVCSTAQEIESWADYPAAAAARYAVLPPGVDVRRFTPYGAPAPDEARAQAADRVERELARFLRRPDRPLILAIARPDRKKNLLGLALAYAGDPELRATANLAIFAGMRDDLDAMPAAEAEVVRDLVLACDRLDLHGELALPKRHDPVLDVPELYRLAARRRGIFVNVALTEPFGLTLLEAAASGLPVVATDQGGPPEIVAALDNGLVVRPTDRAAIAAAMRALLGDARRWDDASARGIRNLRGRYDWSGHAASYVARVRERIAELAGGAAGDVVDRRAA